MNPLQLMKMLRGAGNPMQMLMSAAGQNPLLSQVMQMVNGQTPTQMRDMAYNLARQKGLNIEEIAQQMGIKLPN